MLREACDGNIEVVAVLLTNVSYEVDPMDKSALDCLPFVLAQWRVAAEGENVSAAVRFGILEGRLRSRCNGRWSGTYPQRSVDLLLWHVCASQMHARLDPDHPLTCLDELRCKVRGSPASIPSGSISGRWAQWPGKDSPSNVDEFWTKRTHALYTIQQILETLYTAS